MNQNTGLNTKIAWPSFLSGGGEMGAHVRNFNWQQHLLGLPAQWPQSLCSAVGILLYSKFPMFLFWGDEAICFYNDAYRPSLGKDGEGKHPCIGKKGKEVWPEIWHMIGPQIEQVMGGGEATWYENQLVPIYRNGKLEDVYWTYSYSPVFNEEGQVAGVFVTCTETTQGVQALADLQKTERRLEENKQRLQAALDASLTGTFRWNIATNELVWDENLDRLFGLPPGRTVQSLESFVNCVHPADRKGVIDQCLRCAEEGANFNMEFRVVWPDGSLHWLHDKGKTFCDEAGKPQFMTGACLDITEHKAANEALLKSEQRFEAAVRAMQGVLWTNNALGEMEGEQPGWSALTGQSYEEYRGFGWSKAVHPNDAQHTIDAWNEAVREKKTFVFEHRVKLKSGTWGLFSIRAIPLINEDGSIREWVGVHTDISQQRQAEEKLRVSEEQLRLFVDHAPAAIAMFDKEIRYLAVSQRWKKDYSLTGQIVGRSHYDIFPDMPQRWKDIHQRALQGEVLASDDDRFDRKDGSTIWLKWEVRPWHNSTGGVGGIVVFSEDITDRKQSDMAVKESEMLFRTLVEQAPVATCVFVGRELRIEVANEKIIAIMGKGPLVLGKPLAEAVPELKSQPFLQELDKVFITGETYENRNARGELVIDGELKTFYFDYIFKPLKNAKGEVYAILDMTIDVTDHVLARQELEESRAQLKQLSDFMPQIVWATKADGYHDFFNQRWYDFTGLSYEETKSTGWANVLHPEDYERTWQVWNNSLQTGDLYEIEYRMRRCDGAYRWLLARAMPVRNMEGEIVRWFGTCTDIHEQKMGEVHLEQLVAERTRELHRSNEDLQQFAHVASHDLKEPVRKVITFQNRLKNELGSQTTERAALYLQKIEAASMRMYSMIDGVMAYSTFSATAFTKEPVDLNEVFKNVETDLELIIAQKGATIQKSELPVVSGSPILLHQLFYNLIANSIKFARAGVPPVISVTAGAAVAAFAGEEAVQQYTHRLVVQDNGIGFEQSQAEAIFRSFSRLNPKDKFEGTGLGLSLCKKIVERHGGSIEAQGIPGEGARFILNLPM